MYSLMEETTRVIRPIAFDRQGTKRLRGLHGVIYNYGLAGKALIPFVTRNTARYNTPGPLAYALPFFQEGL